MTTKLKNESLWSGFGAFIQFQVALVSGQAQVQMDWSLLVTQVFPRGAVELKVKEGVRFKMNRDRIKLYFGHKELGNKVIEEYHLDEV